MAGCPQELFEYHPDLIQTLARESGPLVQVLLDGLLWHSKQKYAGRKVKVNYYIRDLYGDPDHSRDPWLSPLAWLVELGDQECFQHPAVRKTFELKWRLFGLRIFFFKELSYMVMLFLFMWGIVADHSGCLPKYDVSVDWAIDREVTFVELALDFLLSDRQENVPPTKPWFLHSTTSQISILSTPMAAFTYTIGIMLNDISHSLFMILVLLAAFGSALTVLAEGPFNEGLDTTLVVLFQTVRVDVALRLLLCHEGSRYDRTITCIEIESFMPLSWRRCVLCARMAGRWREEDGGKRGKEKGEEPVGGG
eukprot:747112-Hanusia_phi.AAC.3